MARQSRQQRRERRAQQQPAPALAGGPPAAPPRTRPTAAAGGEPHREPRRETAAGGLPGLRFIRESWAELKKVEWPSQRQVITGTTVVLIACAVVGVYLYLNDIVWKHVVQNFLVK